MSATCHFWVISESDLRVKNKHHLKFKNKRHMSKNKGHINKNGTPPRNSESQNEIKNCSISTPPLKSSADTYGDQIPSFRKTRNETSQHYPALPKRPDRCPAPPRGEMGVAQPEGNPKHTREYAYL